MSLMHKWTVDWFIQHHLDGFMEPDKSVTAEQKEALAAPEASLILFLL